MSNDYDLIMDHLRSIVSDYKDAQVTGWFSYELDNSNNFEPMSAAIWATHREDGQCSYIHLNNGVVTLYMFNIFTGEKICHLTTTLHKRMDNMYIIFLDLDERFN